MVESPKRVGRPVVGWRQSRSASTFSASCSLPGSGGEASSGPMTAKRRRAHWSRAGGGVEERGGLIGWTPEDGGVARLWVRSDGAKSHILRVGPLPSDSAQDTAGQRREKTQGRRQPFAEPARKRTQKTGRQAAQAIGLGEVPAGPPPEAGRAKPLPPPAPPALPGRDRQPHPEALFQLPAASLTRSAHQGCNQNRDPRNKPDPTKETPRRRRAAAIALSAGKTQALVVALLKRRRHATRLARIVADMQPATAKPATRLPAATGQLQIQGKKRF